VVTAGGAFECIGWNEYGQLGNGTTNTSSTTTWQTAISTGAVEVACGDIHTCALMATGHAYCWGYNGDGELGDGTYTQRTSPVLVSGF
jgi:alpha-tubulin suppressor-like RCC1 family protein